MGLTVRKQPHLSLRQIFVWLTLYALLLGTLANLPLVPLQYVAAMAVLTLFVIADAYTDWNRDSPPKWAATAMGIAFYATAAAAITAACFALHLLLPEPPTPPRPPLSFLGAVFHVVSGQLFAEIGEALAREIGTRVTYLVTFAVFNAVALVAALAVRRHFRAAMWLAIADCPGTLFLIGAGVILLMDVLFPATP